MLKIFIVLFIGQPALGDTDLCQSLFFDIPTSYNIRYNSPKTTFRMFRSLTADSAKELDLKEVKILRKFNLRSSFYYVGSYHNNKVFIKILDSENALDEIKWHVLINDLGLGTKLYGYSKMGEKTAIVSEFIDDASIAREAFSDRLKDPSYLALANSNIRFTSQIETEIERASDVLSRAGIVAGDLQFLVSDHRLPVIVDPELYYLEYPLYSPGLAEVRNARSAKKIIADLKSALVR